MTIHIPSLPLSKASFHPSGSSLLLAGTRPYYYTYDLAAQQCIRSPRNLFGSAPSPSSPNTLATHRFSSDGKLLAVAGRRGHVSIIEWNNGAGAVVAELRSGRGGTVEDLQWSHDGSELSVLGGRDGAEIEIWNVGERRIARKWRDDGVFGGRILENSWDSAMTAIG
jgi:U3 small nucleolar RNA-associated protein 18